MPASLERVWAAASGRISIRCAAKGVNHGARREAIGLSDLKILALRASNRLATSFVVTRVTDRLDGMQHHKSVGIDGRAAQFRFLGGYV